MGNNCYAGLRAMFLIAGLYALALLAVPILMLMRRWRLLLGHVFLLGMVVFGIPLSTWVAGLALRGISYVSEVNGAPPAISTRVPLVLMINSNCRSRNCGTAEWQIRGDRPGIGLRLADIRDIDFSAPVAVSDLPLVWLDDDWWPTPLSLEERAKYGSEIDYLIVTNMNNPTKLREEVGGPLLTLIQPMAGLQTRFALVPLDTPGSMDLTTITYDLREIFVTYSGFGVPLFPENRVNFDGAPNAPLTETFLGAVCKSNRRGCRDPEFVWAKWD